MVIWVGVMPGADAVSAALELLDPDPELGLEPEPDEQAATVNAATVCHGRDLPAKPVSSFHGVPSFSWWLAGASSAGGVT